MKKDAFHTVTKNVRRDFGCMKICKTTVCGFIAVITLFSLTACATTGGGGNSLSLLEAIEETADKIAEDLSGKSRVAVVAFESHSDNLSDYIMEELIGALFDHKIEVADRQNLDYVFKELNLQMSGNVSDESAQAIGKFLAAEMVITGQLRDLGSSYRLMTTAVRVETATRASVPRLNVRRDRAMAQMIAALSRQQTTVRTAKYGVSADVTPQTAGAFLDRGIMFASRGDYEKAIADFDEAIRIDPNMSAAYMLRARALYASVSIVTSVGDNFIGVDTVTTGGQFSAEQGRVYDQAIAALTTAIRLDPNNAKSYMERGIVYADKGDFDRAIADYNQAIRFNPNYALAYTNRGSVYDYKNDYDRAIADHTRAIKLDPNFVIAYYNRGRSFYYKNDYNRAIADFTSAIRLDPNDAMAYYNRGRVYEEKEDYDRAIADYTSAIRLDPNNAADAYNNRGNVYYNKNDYDRAIADFNQALRLDPNDTMAYVNRGNAYDDKGDYDRAIADFNQAIRLDPNNAMAYNNRGRVLYEEKEDYDRAIADFNQALRLDPNNAMAYYNRGNAYYYKNDYNRAIADWEAALRIDPNFADAKDNIEIVRQQRGR